MKVKELLKLFREFETYLKTVGGEFDFELFYEWLEEKYLKDNLDS